jgi:uncharacterized protein (TIGR02391 family)
VRRRSQIRDQALEVGCAVGSSLDSMATIADFTPSADDAVVLPAPVLAIHLLRFFRAANAEGGTTMCHPHNLVVAGNWPPGYVGGSWRRFQQALMEAWAYLVAQGLVAPVPEQGAFHFITRRGLEVAAEAEPLHRLSNEARIGAGLHARIAGTVRQQFLLGEYELAAFTAMREVEIRVRDLAAEPVSTIGVNLMKKAFNAGGTLADPALDPGERDATMALFWGAIGVFKNPSSHRQVRFEDPGEAADVIQLADLLHRLLDRTEARIKP